MLIKYFFRRHSYKFNISLKNVRISNILYHFDNYYFLLYLCVFNFVYNLKSPTKMGKNNFFQYFSLFSKTFLMIISFFISSLIITNVLIWSISVSHSPFLFLLNYNTSNNILFRFVYFQLIRSGIVGWNDVTSYNRVSNRNRKS